MPHLPHLIDLKLLFSVFGVIFVAELPDKTALAALVLATRHRALPVFLGAALALTIQSVIAVAAGGLVSLLPATAVHFGAGVLFVVSSVFMWRRGQDADLGSKDAREQAGFLRTVWIVFAVVFVVEWGHLTQIATAGFAARYAEPVT